MSAVPTDVAARADSDLLWLGVDGGTQGVRVLVMTGAGVVVSSGSQPLPAGFRDGDRHEQDPETWWQALCAASNEAMAGVAGRPVAGLAIDSTSGTVLVQDRLGRPRGTALMYDDSRARAQAARVADAGAQLWASLGYRMQPSWALPKVRWLLDEGLVGAGDRVVHQGDHLGARLVGHEVASDTSSVLKTGYDLLGLRWPTDVLDRLEIDPVVLPGVVLPGSRLGEVSAAAAAATGIPAGTPLHAGMTDGCAAQLAGHALAPGTWSSALGTTLVIKGSTPTLLLDPSGAVYCHRNPDGGWLPGGASSSGAGVIARQLPGRDLAALTDAAARLDGPVPGFVYPLVGAGERFPFVAADAVAVEPGTTDDATRFAALLQAVAFVERLAYDVLRGLGADTSGPVTVSGGATRNAHWNQLRCDVLGRPVRLPASSEAAVGAAVLAAAPVGRLAETVDRMVTIQQTLLPDPAGGDRWAGAYLAFCAELVRRDWLDPSRLPADVRTEVPA